jgi:molybdenum cofactor synthesis domain-containing protein
MRLIRTEDAVGQVLCHDITQIIKEVTKDVVFQKGHIITEKDIQVLLNVGKDHIYIWEKEEGIIHENEAAEILCKICYGNNMVPTQPKEGKIDLIATCDGLLKVDKTKMKLINSMGEMMIASRHGNFSVKKRDKIAGTRIIPLIIEEEKMLKAKEVCEGSPILDILPFVHKKVGIITTGNEVFYGRIQDTFTPVLKEKLAKYDISHVTLNDDDEKITNSIHVMLEEGADIILCSGGMSVDPDDKTPLAIKNTGAEIISYGAPVLPGAMFLLAYHSSGAVIMGLPGCVMYAKNTIFDLVLPRVMANDIVTAEELSAMGEGGLCLSCHICTFPNCGFGKGTI